MSIINFPRFIEFQTHSYCNSRCLYCPYELVEKENFEKGYMEEDLFEKIIEECSNYNIERMIPYLNNEPFIDKNYINRIRLIREKMPNVFIEIATNAELLTEEIAEALFDLTVDEVRMSIHGLNKETYNTMMKGLEYDKVYSNVEKLLEVREKKGGKTNLAAVCLKANIISRPELEKIREHWESKDIEFMIFDVMDRAGNVEKDPLGQFDNRKLKEKVKGCKFNRPLERIHILFNGDVISCDHDWRRENILGNIKASSIYEVWNGDNYKRFREYSHHEKSSPTNFICKRCSLAI